MTKIKYKKLILTGGHAATPALGTVEEIKKRNKDWTLYWVGPTSAMEAQKVATAAEKTLHEYGVIIKKIVAGRALRRGNVFNLLKAYVKIPVGFVHAFFVVLRINPDMVLSFGGFAALPVVFASWLLGKPVVIQEQITGAGLANKLSAPFAKKIAVAREESLFFFPKGKTILIGNPQVAKFFEIKPKNKLGNPPVLFVTGGSSGSQIINRKIAEILPALLESYIVIHQTGENNLDELVQLKDSLPEKLRKNYEVFGYLNPNQFAKYFEKADIIVSRSGANTVSDIVASRTPAILIPLPWAIGDEQNKNALKAYETGLVSIIEESNLTAETLLAEITKIKSNWTTIVKNVKSSDYDLDRNAASKLVNILEDISG